MPSNERAQFMPTVRYAVLTGLIAAALAIPVTSGPAGAADVIALDSFDRTSSSGWRSADSGGSYEVTPRAAGLSVDGENGVIMVRAGSRSARLSDVTVRDTDIRFRVQLRRWPKRKPVTISALLRGDDRGYGYRAQVEISPRGLVRLSIVRVTTGGSRVLGAPRLIRTRLTQNGWLWIRAQAQGSGRTVIRAKAWRGGTREPGSWAIGTRDRSRGLQDAGKVGVRASLARGGTPVKVLFDDLRVVGGGTRAISRVGPR